MKLIKCNIKGYGKFKDFSVDFTEGLNSFCYENGWGKSTICSFIKVMFYGFDDEGKTSVLNERTHYLPWDGGSYGGSLVFETKGKCYEIKREFSAKKNTCNFSLYDYATGLPSYDYSEKIGEEVFGIDMESFKRTIFISQSDLEYKLTDSINAKIGDLVDNTEDLNSYEIIDDRLKEVLNKCSPTRSTGRLNKLHQRIEDLKVKKADKSLIDAEINRILDNIDAKKAEIHNKEIERKTVSEKLRVVGEYKDKAAKKEIYENILKNYQDKKNTLDRLNDYFPVRVPSPEEISDKIKKVTELNILEAKSENLKSFLAVKSPESVEKDKCRFEELDRIYGLIQYDDLVTTQYIRLWQEIKEIKATLPHQKSNLAFMEQTRKEAKDKLQKTKKITVLIFLLLAIIFALGAVVTFDVIVVSSVPVLSVILAIISIAFLISSVVSSKRKIKLSPEDERINSEMIELENQIADDENYIENALYDIAEYIQEFAIQDSSIHDSFINDSALEDLFLIRDRAIEYSKLKNNLGNDINEAESKLTKYNDIQNEIASINRDIQNFLSSIGKATDNNGNSDMLVWFTTIRDNAIQYMNYKHYYEKALEDKRKFEDENPNFEQLINLEKPLTDESVALLENEVISITNEQRLLDKQLKSFEDQLANKRQELDVITWVSEEYETLSEQYNLSLEKYKITEKARKYLQEAKNNLTNKYTKPLKKIFDEYYEKLTAISKNSFSMDANMQLTIDNTLKKLSPSYLSSGNQDVMNLCMRLALIDSMFCSDESEDYIASFIVLDDPFERMDDQKLELCKKFINELSDKKQIIYFTCFEGRNCN